MIQRHSLVFLTGLLVPAAVGTSWRYPDAVNLVNRRAATGAVPQPGPTAPPSSTDSGASAQDGLPCGCFTVDMPTKAPDCTEQLSFEYGLQTVYTTLTETYTADAGESAGPETLITPPPPCNTYSCVDKPCYGLFPFLGKSSPPVSISITKKTTIAGPIATNTPPSFDDDVTGQDEHGSDDTEPAVPDDEDGEEHDNANHDAQGIPDSADNTSPGNKPDSPAHAPPVTTRTLDDGTVIITPIHPVAKPAGSEPTPAPLPAGYDYMKAVVTMNGVPVTIYNQHSASIVFGDKGDADQVTVSGSDSMPTTINIDGRTFTVSSDEIICGSTTFFLEPNPTATSPPMITGGKNENASNSDSASGFGSDSIYTDSTGGTVHRRPTGAGSSHSTTTSLAVGGISEQNMALLIGMVTTCILGGIVGFL